MSYKIPRMKIHSNPELLGVINTCIEKGGYVTGNDINLFEKKLLELFKRRYCSATINGFAALFLAIKATRIYKQNILLPAISTCFSMVNAIKASRNNPVFCDVDPSSGNISVESAKQILKQKGFSLIISPNHFGIRSNIKELQKFDVPIIEDAAQSFFSNLNYESTADFLVFSFYPTKMINAIDGGAVLTNKKKYDYRIKKLISYRDQLEVDDEARYNMKMPNIHAAIGLQSINTSENIISILSKIILPYKEILNKLQTKFLGYNSDGKNVLKQLILVFPKKEKTYRFMKFMKERDVEASKELIQLTELDGSYINSSHLLNCHCSIPFYETLKKDDQAYILNLLYEANKADLI